MDKIGLDCVLYYLSTGSWATWGTADADGVHEGVAPANLVEMTRVRDVTRNMNSGEVEVGKDRAATFVGARPTFKAFEGSIKYTYDTSDTGYKALMKAYLAGTPIALAFLDDDKDVADTEGDWANVVLLSREESEPLEGEVEVTFNYKKYGDGANSVERVRVAGS